MDATGLDPETIVRTVRHPLLVLSGGLDVQAANPAFYKSFHVHPRETLGRPLFELGGGQWNIRALHMLLEHILPKRRVVEDFRIEHDFEQIGRRILLLNGRQMQRSDDQAILLVIEDITAQERARFELEGQKELAEKIVGAVRDPLLVLGWDLRVRFASASFYSTFKVDSRETEGRLVYDLGNGQFNIPALRNLLEHILPDRNTFDDFRVEHAFEHIGPRTMILNARQVNHLQLILLAIEDITERKRAEEAVRKSEQRLRTVLETEAVGVLFFDNHGTLTDANETFLRMTGHSRGAVMSRALTRGTITPSDWIAPSAEQMQRLETTGRSGPYETEYLRADGSRAWMMSARRRVDEDSIVEFCMDVSDRKRVELERELLSRELHHRVKNMFAVAQALAGQTKGFTTVEAFRDTFVGRLQAMARTHAMLLDADWSGTNVHALVRNALEPYRRENANTIAIAGDPIGLNPAQALALSLVLHELETNAIKFGALTTEEGCVRVSWQHTPKPEHPRGVLYIRWEERQGPPVIPPTESGFGTQLINRVANFQLHGTVKLQYPKQGVVCEVEFPLE